MRQSSAPLDCFAALAMTGVDRRHADSLRVTQPASVHFKAFAIFKCAVTVGTIPLANVFSCALSPEAA